MTEEIFEAVEVGAVFAGEKVRPGWFVWNKRRYPVEKVNYVWRDSEGEEVIYYFSVLSGSAAYQLAYHSLKLKWVLDRVYLDG